jgi:minichromosome maintenance protein 10
VTIFLFGAAYKTHWKTPVGAVVGVLNPQSMPPKDGDDAVCLRVEVDQKVLHLGTSKDFGLCRAKTKAGRNCHNFVNR